MGGESCNGVVTRNDNEILLTFTEHEDLEQCTESKTNCKGTVKFRVKHKAGFDLRDTEQIIHPGTTTVYFDNAPFVIDHFIDPWIPKPLSRVVSVNNCCYCETQPFDPRILAGAAILFIGVFVFFRRRLRGK
jgi:hypothetical protein